MFQLQWTTLIIIYPLWVWVHMGVLGPGNFLLLAPWGNGPFGVMQCPGISHLSLDGDSEKWFISKWTWIVPSFRPTICTWCRLFPCVDLFMCLCVMRGLLLYPGASQKMAWRRPSRWTTWDTSTLSNSCRMFCVAQPLPVSSWSLLSPTGGFEFNLTFFHLSLCLHPLKFSPSLQLKIVLIWGWREGLSS